MLLLAGLFLPFLGLETRLVQMQLVEPETFVGTGPQGHQNVELLRARRGTITDSRGAVLAEDVRAFDCHLVLEEYEKNPGPLAELLARPGDDGPGMTAEEFQRAVEEIYDKIAKQIRRRPRSEWHRLYLRERRTPYLLRRGIPFDAAIVIETAPQIYSGALVRESLKRSYPFKQVGCHLLGYLGRPGGPEFEALRDSGHFTEGFEEIIGEDGIARLHRRGIFTEELLPRAGIEKQYQQDLRGRAGLAIHERQPGTSVRKVTELLPVVPGQRLELTIDIETQAAVEDVLAGALHSAAVVLDPRSGAVIAMASNRRYDPNDFLAQAMSEASQRRARVLTDDEGRPLQSRAFQQRFALGSIFKVVTSVAGLEEKVVRATELLPCRGRFRENSRFFACHLWNSHQGMHGEINLHVALERSCNCYFYEVGQRLELPTLAKWALALGYGAPTGVDLPGEVAGLLPLQARNRDQVLSLAIGQDELMVTPLQAAVMMAAIANGGFRVTPHLLRSAATAPKSLGLSPETVREVRQGLQDVVHSAHGTAHATSLKDFKAAGKTSSAQAGSRVDSHAWFAGYAPYEDPKFVVCVFVQNGGHGGEAAAPLTARILEILFRGGREKQK